MWTRSAMKNILFSCWKHDFYLFIFLIWFDSFSSWGNDIQVIQAKPGLIFPLFKRWMVSKAAAGRMRFKLSKLCWIMQTQKLLITRLECSQISYISLLMWDTNIMLDQHNIASVCWWEAMISFYGFCCAVRLMVHAERLTGSWRRTSSPEPLCTVWHLVNAGTNKGMMAFLTGCWKTRSWLNWGEKSTRCTSEDFWILFLREVASLCEIILHQHIFSFEVSMQLSVSITIPIHTPVALI